MDPAVIEPLDQYSLEATPWYGGMFPRHCRIATRGPELSFAGSPKELDSVFYQLRAGTHYL